MALLPFCPWKNSNDKPKQHIKKQRYHFADKGPYSQSYGFSGSHVRMWELDHKEGWVPKNWCFLITVLEKALETSLGQQGDETSFILKEINPEYSLEVLMLKLQQFGYLMQRVNSLEKNSDSGKDWGQEKGVTEDEMVRWHHRLNGHESEQILGDSEGQGSLVHCS